MFVVNKCICLLFNCKFVEAVKKVITIQNASKPASRCVIIMMLYFPVSNGQCSRIASPILKSCSAKFRKGLLCVPISYGWGSTASSFPRVNDSRS